MKNINKLTETNIAGGSTSTSDTTSGSAGSSGINVPAKELKKTDVQQSIASLTKANPKTTVNVVEDNNALNKIRLEYLSEVKDENGEMHKPFTINGKNYQMVRAITPDRQKTMGVYSLDEMDETGKNIIYNIDEFEENIAKKALQSEEIPAEESSETKPQSLNPGAGNIDIPEKNEETSFAGFKHFIVNKKKNKARKFKTIEELAKANMTPEEEYMGIKGFKKYVDEVLFGGSKRQMKEDDVQPQPQAGSPKLMANAEKLMDIINQKIPSDTIPNIQQNPEAQEQVILAFAKLIGVPANRLSNIITGIQSMAKQIKPTQPSNAPASNAPATNAPVTNAPGQQNENRVIKTIKVKEL